MISKTCLSSNNGIIIRRRDKNRWVVTGIQINLNLALFSSTKEMYQVTERLFDCQGLFIVVQSTRRTEMNRCKNSKVIRAVPFWLRLSIFISSGSRSSYKLKFHRVLWRQNCHHSSLAHKPKTVVFLKRWDCSIVLTFLSVTFSNYIFIKIKNWDCTVQFVSLHPHTPHSSR